MSSYIRKLSYLYYYENGHKGINAGYAKLERREGVIRFKMNIRFRLMGEAEPVLYLYGKPRGGEWTLVSFGKCQGKNNQLTLGLAKKEEELFPKGMTVEDVHGILLPLEGKRFFASSWTDEEAGRYFWLLNRDGREVGMDGDGKEVKAKPESMMVLGAEKGLDGDALENKENDEDVPKNKILAGNDVMEKPASDGMENRGSMLLKEKPDAEFTRSAFAAEKPETGIARNAFAAEKPETGIARSRFAAENPAAQNAPINNERHREAAPDMTTMEWVPPEQVRQWLPIKEEKITPELVFSVYPKLPEFLSCKKCIRIEPQDIGILPMESWFLATNSFLLHGYFNFNHLLLGWKMEKPEAFILGVPGIYDRREKIMAGMFGFEEFDVMGEPHCKKSQISEGTMGYWYRFIEPSLRQEKGNQFTNAAL